MGTARATITASILGAATGAMLSVALFGDVAHADVLPTLPVPPFDYDQYYYLYYPSNYGTPGDITNDVGTRTDFSESFDQAYSSPTGSFEVHEIAIHPLFQYSGLYADYTETVTSSDGVAPAVGTTFDNSYSEINLGLGAHIRCSTI